MNGKVPSKFFGLFWDVDAARLDIQKDDTFILERLLEMGDDEAIAWVRKTYPEQAIVETVRNSRRLSRKTARFWQIMLGLEEEEIRCLSRSYRREANQLWPH